MKLYIMRVIGQVINFLLYIINRYINMQWQQWYKINRTKKKTKRQRDYKNSRFSNDVKQQKTHNTKNSDKYIFNHTAKQKS